MNEVAFYYKRLENQPAKWLCFMYSSCNSMNKAMTNIIPRLKEANEIVAACHGDTMSFEQAFAIARFYYDLQDTEALIAEAEAMVGYDPAGLRMIALSLKAETATLLNNINNIGLLDGVDFRGIANAHSRYYYALFQKASP